MSVDDRFLRFDTTPSGLDPARVTVATAPAVEPWLESDDEVGQFLRRDTSADSALVTAILKAARLHFERQTGLSLVNQTLLATWDGLPRRGGIALNEIELPRAPLVSIASVKYLDASGVEQTLSSAAYSAINAGCSGAFGRLALNPAYDWPDLGDYRGALRITFVAGFGSAATDVPADLRLAVLWLAAWWYEARLPVNIGNITSEMPHHLNAMIESHRLAFLG